MTRTCLYTGLGAILTASLLQGIDRQSAATFQKPVKVSSAHTDGGIGTPATLEELWLMSTLVVDAIVGGSRPADLTLNVPGSPTDQGHVIVRTSHALAATEVFRDVAGAIPAGRIIEVIQEGGDRDRGSYIEAVTHPTFPRLKEGHRYLFFLRPARERNEGFVAATDTADSVLSLPGDGRVQSLGNDKLSLQLDRYSREELLTRLRVLAEVRRH